MSGWPPRTSPYGCARRRACSPSDELIGAAQEQLDAPDSIVVGLRHRTAVGKLLAQAMPSGFFSRPTVPSWRSKPRDRADVDVDPC